MRIFILAFILFLAACSSQPVVLTENKHHVTQPESSLYHCPEPTLPETANLTDVGVSRLIVQLYENNSICSSNMKALKKFFDGAREVIEQKQPETSQPPAYVPQRSIPKFGP